ncbi:MAG: DUF2007 domain-containing protein [Actinomycetota bacterium]
MSGAEAAEVARFSDLWEAELARHVLADAGIESWVESSSLDFRVSGERHRPVRLVVAGDQLDEARDILTGDQEDVDPPASRRRPVWVIAVAFVLAVGLIAGAVPRVLWPWLLLAGLVGLLLWATARPGPRS